MYSNEKFVVDSAKFGWAMQVPKSDKATCSICSFPPILKALKPGGNLCHIASQSRQKTFIESDCTMKADTQTLKRHETRALHLRCKQWKSLLTKGEGDPLERQVLADCGMLEQLPKANVANAEISSIDPEELKVSYKHPNNVYSLNLQLLYFKKFVLSCAFLGISNASAENHSDD